MPIIAQVGRRKPGPMILIIGIYLLLVAGSITMVYPFGLMLSTAMTNAPDMYEYELVPRFLHDDDALYRRYLFLRYETHLKGHGTDAYCKLYPDSTASSFRQEDKGVGIPLVDVDGAACRQRLEDLHAFEAQPWRVGGDNDTVMANQDMGYHCLGDIGSGARGQLWQYWQDYLEVKYRNVGKVNEVYRDQYENLDQVKPPADRPDDPSSPMGMTQLAADWDEFKAAYLRPTIENGTERQLRSEKYRGGDLTKYIRPISMTAGWWNYLKRKYLRLSKLNQAWGLNDAPEALPYQAWTQISLPRVQPVSAAMVADWNDFVARKIPSWYRQARYEADADADLSKLPAEKIAIRVADTRWEAFMRQRYASAGGGVDQKKLLAGYGDRFLADYRLRLLMRRVCDHVLGMEPPEDARPPASREAASEAAPQPAAAGEPASQPAAASRPASQPAVSPAETRLAEYRKEQLNLYENATVLLRLVSELRAAGFDQARIDRQVQHELPTGQMEVYKAFREVQAGHGKMEDVDTLLRPQVEAILRVHEMMEAIAAEGTIDASAALAALLADDGARTGGDFDAVSLTRIPLHEDDKAVFMSQRGPLRTYFSTCQFVGAWNRLMFHSDAMFNTVLLVLLTIATHLTVNPMAAYALSRFNLGYTYKVLLLLLATMAFPPAVAMVPNFLMLKSLHLLNTYWALVLPGMANGYSIFLLKGFFDALPKELYEAAEIDGASPVNCFVNITFPMSKPIFAINALSSFNFAYTGFMWAFVRCPDPRKWTLMVHVFNDNQWAIASVQMAILVIASVPTLLMFLFCQKVILRGIIIPSFK